MMEPRRRCLLLDDSDDEVIIPTVPVPGEKAETEGKRKGRRLVMVGANLATASSSQTRLASSPAGKVKAVSKLQASVAPPRKKATKKIKGSLKFPSKLPRKWLMGMLTPRKENGPRN
ncbi:unnamed protein product [Linum trigynum]|uniref:Uncharacterized protein n=1 Tax=Linum trigynum TaxID=586398 RepID=A0AAV2DD49_9ROSI